MKKQSVLPVGCFHIATSWLRRSSCSISYSVSQLQGKQASARFPSTILCVQAEESINISRKKHRKKERRYLRRSTYCSLSEDVRCSEQENLQDIPADFINLKTKLKEIHIHHDRWRLSKVPVASKDGRHLAVVISLSSALRSTKPGPARTQHPNFDVDISTVLAHGSQSVLRMHLAANKCSPCPLVHITVIERER